MGRTVHLLPFSACMQCDRLTFTFTLHYSLFFRQTEWTEHSLCRTQKVNVELYRVHSVSARGVLLSEPLTLFQLTGPDEWKVAS